MLWNQWPEWHGITGRLGVEWVAGMAWNTQEVSFLLENVEDQNDLQPPGRKYACRRR